MKNKERELAIELRKQGQSINLIAKQLYVSKSTVCGWVSDVELTKEQKDQLLANKYITKGQLKASEVNRQIGIGRRKEAFDVGFKKAVIDHWFRVICALYWGEGNKSSNVFRVSNCDYNLLNVIGCWLVSEGYSNKITFTVGYHTSNGVSSDAIKDWWKQKLPFLTDKNFRRFTKYDINRASQKKRIGKQPYGTAAITVCCTKLIHKIYGGIEFLKQGPVSETV